MEKYLRQFLVVLFVVVPLSAQSIYYQRNAFGLTSPGAMKYGQYGFDNPALLSTLTGPDFTFNWTTYKKAWDEQRRVGGQFALPGLGFGFQNEVAGNASATEYNFALSVGDNGLSMGAAYGWSNGDRALKHPSMWTFSSLYRPFKFLSTGLIFYAPDKGEQEAVLEVAVRPLQNELVSVFSDYVYKKNYLAGESKWSAGIALEAFPGIRFTGRYFDNQSVTAGMQFSLGNIGLSSQGYFDKDSKHEYNSYGIRLGAYDRNIFQKMAPVKKLYQVDLIRGLGYTKFKLFDNKIALMDLLSDLDAVKTDASVSGVLLNASGMDGNRELYWEIRENLKELKDAGKEVVIYIDRGGIDEYHFASVASKIIMDPLGTISLEGYLMGRTYFKGTLQKLGIGYDELRFFKYKSAAESFSRDKMSEADREQRQKITDDWYRLAKEDITSSGRISGAEFDTLVNTKIMLLASDALKYKLVDSLVRWDLLQEHFGNSKTIMTG
ncbi:MAG: S49 family peptidase, partial [Ignavibacteriales bacterium]|nr:S49 family peptidase [Ignavibacteriales bacterium]